MEDANPGPESPQTPPESGFGHRSFQTLAGCRLSPPGFASSAFHLVHINPCCAPAFPLLQNLDWSHVRSSKRRSIVVSAAWGEGKVGGGGNPFFIHT